MHRRNFLRNTSACLASLIISGCSLGISREPPQQLQGLNPNSSLEQIVTFLREHRDKAVDYDFLWPANFQVMSFGERHLHNEEQDITNHLDLYRRQGATHLAIEQPMEFQQVVDAYCARAFSDETLYTKLRERSYPYQDGVVGLIRKARDLGMQVVCMDTLDPTLEAIDKDLPKGFWSSTKGRNQHMAQTIAMIIAQNKDARIIAHAGAAHFGYSPQYELDNKWKSTALAVPAYLKEEGIGTFIISYAGGSRVSDSEVNYFLGLNREELSQRTPLHIIDIAAKIAGVDREKFGIKLDETTRTHNWGHYIIHLPQEY